MIFVLNTLLLSLLSFATAEISTNVIGGVNATEASYKDAPWIVSLQMYEEDYAYCGAALITKPLTLANASDNAPEVCSAWIVTTASCLYGIPQKIATLRNFKLKEKDDHEYLLEIKETHTHPEYSESAYLNDITLLKVHFNFTINDNEPENDNITSCDDFKYLEYYPSVPINESLYEYINSTVFGWGLQSENGPLQKQLYQVPVTLQTDQSCADIYGHEFFNGTSMICAGSAGFGPCSYDTGGPLVCEYEDPKDETIHFEYLCGITSFGLGCGKLPVIFTDVIDFKTWIDGVIDAGQGVSTSGA